MKSVIMFLAVLLLFVGSVSASHYQYGAGYYGRNEQTNFYENTLYGQNTDALFSNRGFLDYNAFNGQNTFSGSDLYGLGRLQDRSLFYDASQQGGRAFNGGYEFTRDDPCVTKKIVGNFFGKHRDFSVIQKVCDGITGRFYQSNAINDAYSNSLSQSERDAIVEAVLRQLQNQGSSSQRNINVVTGQDTAAQYSNTIQTSFGKGDYIVLN